MSVHITIGDVTFNTGAGPYAGWDLEIDTGWWGGRDGDRDLLATQSEGSVRGREMLRHRTIVCTGTIEAGDAAGLSLALRQLESLVPFYGTVPFVVHEPAGARMAFVSAVVGYPDPRPFGDRAAEFKLAVVADDGRKYSVASTDRAFPVTTSTSLSNAGNAPAPLTVGTDGPGLVWVGVPDASAPSGIREHLAGHLPAGVVLDGVSRTARTASGQPVPLPGSWGWPAVLPGTAGYSFGTAPMSITYRDTWI